MHDYWTPEKIIKKSFAKNFLEIMLWNFKG